MILETVAKLGKVIFLSPYMNFNLTFGLNLARYLVGSSQFIYIFYEFDIPPSLINMLSLNEAERIRISKNLHSITIDENSTMIIVVNHDILNLSDLVKIKIKNLFIFLPRSKLSENSYGLHICKVHRISTHVYLLELRKQKYFIKINGVHVEEITIPKDVDLVIVELNKLINNFSVVKASDFIKYCIVKLSFSREECIDLVRQAISLGIVKYKGGYLIPVQ
jgi:hypothetical protein